MSTPTQHALYTPEWQRTRTWTHEWSRRALLAALAHVGVPRTMLDIGCAEGHLVTLAAALGIYSVGIDISLPETRSSGDSYALIRGDLTQPIVLNDPTLPSSFELVLCWEVAEHLPAEAADQLVATAARFTAPGGMLLFTAATPGQGGFGHINEQPRDYWTSRLVQAGLSRHYEVPLRTTWTSVCGPCRWYPENLMMFKRSARVPPASASTHPITQSGQ